ncbi:MAG: asparagine synthetase B [Vicinamibacterales bacterium]
MSGIVAIVNPTGASVDPALLQRLTRSMAVRGPDGQDVWIDGSVGFGHAMLRTTIEAEHERQPSTRNRNVWITADARVDGRADLIRRLEDHGTGPLRGCPDAELILRAYEVWDDACVDHIIGDFAFIVWDGARRRLFCARDQFGLKPLYWAYVDSCLVVSNTLNCVRLHPAVSARLNDAAIADLLVLGYNPDPTTTVFADINRLPAAHVLTWTGGSVQTRRYWTLPVDERIRYRRPEEYVEHFNAVLDEAVSDRLRTSRAGIFMSGGLDSTSIAASVRRSRSRAALPPLPAYTYVYDRLIPDEERRYADIAGRALDIPVEFVAADDYEPFEHWDDPTLCRPEPSHEPFASQVQAMARKVAARCRVMLTGDGGDPLLYYETDVPQLLKTGQLWRIGAEVARSLISLQRLPPLLIRSSVKRWLNPPPAGVRIPSWINREFAARMRFEERYREWPSHRVEPAHPIRALSQERLCHPKVARNFECSDPGAIGAPFETANPLFDCRVVRYVLAIPPVPWSISKELLRTPLQADLPEVIRRRPKAPLAGDPLWVLSRRKSVRDRLTSLGPIPPCPYLEPTAFPPVLDPPRPNDLWTNLRPVSLAYWLRWKDWWAS